MPGEQQAATTARDLQHAVLNVRRHQRQRYEQQHLEQVAEQTSRSMEVFHVPFHTAAGATPAGS
jgi:hypothetical protein